MGADKRLIRQHRNCAPAAKEYIGCRPSAREEYLRTPTDGYAWQSHVKWECGIRLARMGRIPPCAIWRLPPVPPGLRPVERRDREGCRGQALAQILRRRRHEL